MRRLGLLGLCMAAVFATGGVASATAAPPEFGRCVRVATGTGAFATGNCTSEGGEQKYEWIPGPPPNPKFTVAFSPKQEFFLLEGVGPPKFLMICRTEQGEGEILSATTIGNLTITFNGCESPGAQCSNSAGAKEVVMTGLTGTLGVVKAGETPFKNTVGLTLAGSTPFQCNGFAGEIRGSAVGVISPTHDMTTKRTWHFRKVKGKQVPGAFEGGVRQTFEVSFAAQPFEEAPVSLWDTFTTAEKVEINPVV